MAPYGLPGMTLTIPPDLRARLAGGPFAETSYRRSPSELKPLNETCLQSTINAYDIFMSPVLHLIRHQTAINQ